MGIDRHKKRETDRERYPERGKREKNDRQGDRE